MVPRAVGITMSDKLNRARGLNSQENGRAWLICGHLWTLASFVAVGVKAKSLFWSLWCPGRNANTARTLFELTIGQFQLYLL